MKENNTLEARGVSLTKINGSDAKDCQMKMAIVLEMRLFEMQQISIALGLKRSKAKGF